MRRGGLGRGGRRGGLRTGKPKLVGRGEGDGRREERYF